MKNYFQFMETQKNIKRGTVEDFTITAVSLERTKTIWMYLPHDYKSSSKRYPILYMHDGQNVFDHAESPKREWHVAEKLDAMEAQAIVVGIEHGGSTHRIDEMTPFKNERYGGGHADDYLDFIINDLKPYIDKRYRTMPGKDNTAIMGASVGGLISFYAMLKFPDVFGRAGVFSPSFWFSEEIFDIIETEAIIDGHIYFMAGDHESTAMVPDMQRMEQLVRERLSEHGSITMRIVHGGHHNEKLWRKEFAEAYRWLMPNCAAPGTMPTTDPGQ